MKRARPAAALKRIGGDLQDRDGHRPPLQGASRHLLMGEQANHHTRAISLKARTISRGISRRAFASAMTQTRNDRTKVPSDR
jgi:hypothetical protein